jgi:hypothetical protein
MCLVERRPCASSLGICVSQHGVAVAVEQDRRGGTNHCNGTSAERGALVLISRCSVLHALM